MRITHFGHSCLLVELKDRRVLIDPGNLAGDFDSLTELDAIAITHQHPDHADPQRLPALVGANPHAMVLAEPQAAEVVAEQTGNAVRPTPLTAGELVRVGEVTVRPVGELHAFIHESVPRVGNLGLVVTADDEPVLFHPGDSYEAEPGPVDVLALPIIAPWATISATADFAARIAAPRAVPIHDGPLSAEGHRYYLGLVGTFGPPEMEIIDLPLSCQTLVES
ncbi:MAG: MBL fold metallo-hydrolase [Nocardioidaceae bacterium]